MLKINIICIGKDKDAWIQEAIGHYIKLLNRFARVQLVYIANLKKSTSLSEKEIMKKEAELINARLSTNYQIALSDKGKIFDSLRFASFWESLSIRQSTIDMIIGGIYGLDNSIIESADLVLSLSPMTFSHQLVRPVILEQLYRAFSINSGGKYHK